MAVFHDFGSLPVSQVLLIKSRIFNFAKCPMCEIISLAILSGPGAFPDFAFLIAVLSSWIVKSSSNGWLLHEIAFCLDFVSFQRALSSRSRRVDLLTEERNLLKTSAFFFLSDILTPSYDWLRVFLFSFTF